MRFGFCLVACCLSLVGCGTVDGEGPYKIESIGNAHRSIEGTVESSRPVRIAVRPSGAGAVAGGAAGGALASNSDNVAVIFAGIVAGAIVGDVVEASANVHKGTEYVVATTTDARIRVAEIDSGQPRFDSGSRVKVMYGFPCRLLGIP